MATKKSRKELLNEPDEFISFADQAYDWVKENLKLVLIALGSILVIVVAVLSIMGYLQSRRHSAALALAQAFPAYSQVVNGDKSPKTVQEAMAAMSKVAEEYGSTPSGLQASLAQGSLFMLSGKFAEAGKIYARLSEESSESKSFRPLAMRGLGQSQEAVGKLKEAADTYGKAIALAGPNLADLIKMDQARVLAAAGDKKQAEGIYRRMAGGTGNAVLAAEAKNRLVEMGLRP